ncbi:MAG: response regulator [Proteobacteria bacterium]|nr:response regulator [Pseudomonadota bacterium]
MGEQHTVLVVEDNDFVRIQIVTFLQGAGYRTIEAVDGNEALDLMNRDISVAVVDVRMEPMSGFDFIAITRADGYKIPVILVTGDQDTTILEKAGKLGVASVLMKPVQRDRLVSMVGRLVERGVR